MARVLPDTLKQALERKRRHAAKLLRTLRFLSSESTLFADLRAERDLDDATLARVACPLLCVYGTHSSCRAVGARLARVVPGARLVELDAGHFLPVEKPRELGDVLEEFLRG
jgi:pimeloyl-ACP methyl ester carboxylesterase